MRNHFGPEDFRGIWHPAMKIVYDKPPLKCWQGMPVGTGKTGAVVWVSGGLELQINHTDCWAADGGLPSLGRIGIEIDGNPFEATNEYFQELNLKEGLVRIKSRNADGEIKVEIRAHPEIDVICVEIADMRKQPGKIKVFPICWRKETNILQRDNAVILSETNHFSGFDSLNRESCVCDKMQDPLAGLSYGLAIAAQCCGNTEYKNHTIREISPERLKRIIICAGVDKDNLVHNLESRLEKARGINDEDFKNSHSLWWKRFWDKSYFDLAPDSRLQPARAAWYMSRYFTACTMGGKYPPKFNGSIFLYEYDRRGWGGAYWFQNTRLQYCPLYKTGDIQYMMQFFDMYYNALEYQKKRVKSVYSHQGAIYIETMHFWGAARRGSSQEGKGITNKYIKRHFSGSLELLMMMCEYYRYTKDIVFAKEKMFPVAEEILRFFFCHFPVVNGKLYLEKSYALETWWEADNPADQVAGLKAVLPALISAACDLGFSSNTVSEWRIYCSQLPELPRGKMKVIDGVWHDPLQGNEFLPALNVHDKIKRNYEEAELYALWPFNLFGLDLPEYDDVLATYSSRLNKEPCWGWSQTAVWAARLGLAEEAANMLLKQFDYCAALPGGMMASPGDRLPGRMDIPDCGYFDTIGVMATAVNEMLTQDYTGEVKILPAWPENEEVNFKLHAPEGRIIERSYCPKKK